MKKIALAALGVLALSVAWSAASRPPSRSTPSPVATAPAPAAPATPIASPTASATRYSLQDFEQLKSGMTLAEVEQILGAGKTVSKMNVGGQEIIFRAWEDGKATISIDFIDGRANSVSQFGLQ